MLLLSEASLLAKARHGDDAGPKGQAQYGTDAIFDDFRVKFRLKPTFEIIRAFLVVPMAYVDDGIVLSFHAGFDVVYQRIECSFHPFGRFHGAIRAFFVHDDDGLDAKQIVEEGILRAYFSRFLKES